MPDAVPVFIVGCGRSGTTALGRTLGQHPDVTYLNEPREVWSLDPRTDIWSARAESGGRIEIDDVEDDVAQELRGAFAARTPDGTLMVEKTPINAFRIGFLRAVYPDARVLHLLRDGRDVAQSIAKRFAERGRWYGKRDAKWKLLADYAERRGLGGLAKYCGGDGYRRGLLEWRLAVTHVQQRLLPGDLEIRYRQVVDNPTETLDSVADWTGLDPRGFGDLDLARRSPTVTAHDPAAEYIAGDLLRRLGYPT